ncbi:MAG: class I SAM-dependent methyltransferase [Pirellulaceae bacterium]
MEHVSLGKKFERHVLRPFFKKLKSVFQFTKRGTTGRDTLPTNQLTTLLDTLSDVNSRQLASQNEINNLVQSVPVTLRALTRDGLDLRRSLENVLESVSYLLGRVEFVRRELMFEMRYGASSPAKTNAQLRATTEILSLDKVTQARNDGLRLNLGCGHVPLDGYINIDRRGVPGVDIVAEVDELPFTPGEVDEIFSAHLLEHFPQEQLRRELLTYWYSLLKPGGIFRAIVPDADSMIKAYTSGEYSFRIIKEVTYGGQDYDGDFHFNMFTPASLSALLSEAGFTSVSIVAENRDNDHCKEFEICAVRENGATSPDGL